MNGEANNKWPTSSILVDCPDCGAEIELKLTKDKLDNLKVIIVKCEHKR
jgi:hypothetical protein